MAVTEVSTASRCIISNVMAQRMATDLSVKAFLILDIERFSRAAPKKGTFEVRTSGMFERVVVPTGEHSCDPRPRLRGYDPGLRSLATMAGRNA